MFRNLKDNMNMKKRENKKTKQKQMELVELKTTTLTVKNSLNGINSRLNVTEESLNLNTQQ